MAQFSVQKSYFTNSADLDAEVARRLAEIDGWINDPNLSAVDKAYYEDNRYKTVHIPGMYATMEEVVWYEYDRPHPATFDVGTGAAREHVDVDKPEAFKIKCTWFEDEEYESRSFEVVDGGALGTGLFTDNIIGTLTYIPNTSATGDDEVTYKIIVTYRDYRGYLVDRESEIKTCYLEIS